MEEKIELEYINNYENFIDLLYDGKKFPEIYMKHYYEKNNENQDYVEFLPGVYYKRELKYKERFTEKYEKKNRRNLFLLIFYELLDKLIYEKQKVKISFKIENKRDSIIILKNDEEKYRQDIPYGDPLAEKYEKTKVKYYGEQKVEYKEVETEKICYPDKSGGDGERCRIKGIFQKLGMLNICSNNEYVFFTEHEMFFTSANTESLMYECKRFSKCKNMYEKFANNTYENPSGDYWGDNIELEENNNGIYRIANANHRVCCAKRFKINKVYAKVYNEVSSKNETKLKSLYSEREQTYDHEAIKKSFYNKLYKLGLTEENARYILKEGLRNEKLVNYIEKITGKSLYKIALDKQL